MIHRHDAHPPWRWFADRRDGTLSPERAQETDAHLATGCGRCRARDASVRRVVAAVAAGPLEAPPAAADRRVVALFSRAQPRRAEPGTLVGVLVFDQHLDLATSVRSGDADARRLLWALDGYEVDASVVRREGGADVLGQVVPEGDDPAATTHGVVRAVRGRRVVASSEIASDGRFTFRALASGPYVFEGTVEGRAFVLPLVVLE